MRLHIGVFGRRNVGKSSIFNNLLHQQVSIVSPVAGTTTDPVEKAMELQPIGPVLFVDTAGIDDMGALGGQRVMQTRKVIERVDVAILVSDAWTEYEAHLLELFAKRKAPVIFVANKADVRSDRILEEDAQKAGVDNVITVSAVRGSGFDHVREAIIRTVPEEFIASPVILSDLVPPGKLAILVIPVDKEAPKGRLILPQAQAIRDLLDHDAGALVVKDSELDMALRQLKEPPALVVTDSQAFEKVAALVPQDVPMTGFSVLFARCKGDLTTMARGAAVVANLRPGARVLIAVACAHHPITDVIGRV
jgi:[FeFe] hydrogenase H-cluster maturation GTPase HydF